MFSRGGTAPYLIIGIGGTGRQVVEALRSRLGDVDALPVVATNSRGEAAPDIPAVYVVGSVAGGTGSGLVAVRDVLRRPFTKEQIAELLRSPAGLYRLSAVEFEDFMAEVYRARGYSVHQTPRSHDGGIDLILDKTIDGMPQRFLVQCKHTRMKRRAVGVAALRELLGTLSDHPATGAILATNACFSTSALKLLRRHMYRLLGVDGPGILKLAGIRVAPSS